MAIRFYIFLLLFISSTSVFYGNYPPDWRASLSWGVGSKINTFDLYSGWEFDHIEIGGGLGYHNNSFAFFSASDEHTVQVNHIPIFASIRYKFTSAGYSGLYIRATAGRANIIKTENNIGAKKTLSPYLKGSLGYAFESGIYSFFIELSQYYTHLQGTFSSTYNSSINYNIDFFKVVGNIGISINISERFL